jgi:hypothetical protein
MTRPRLLTVVVLGMAMVTRAYRSGGYAACASPCWTGKLGYQRRNTVANSWFSVLTRSWRSRCAARFVHWLGKGRAQCKCLFLHPPRLEPCIRFVTVHGSAPADPALSWPGDATCRAVGSFPDDQHLEAVENFRAVSCGPVRVPIPGIPCHIVHRSVRRALTPDRANLLDCAAALSQATGSPARRGLPARAALLVWWCTDWE